MSRRTALVIGVTILLAGLSGGCPSAKQKVFTPRRVNSLSEAGSAHVSVTFVAPWDDYTDDLQPHFSMDADSALKEVLPSTQSLDQKMLDVLQGRLAVATQKLPGPAPTAAGPPAAPTPGTAPAGTAAGLTSTPVAGFTPGTDPMLQHWAALALFQEVKLLNRYVQNAALRYNNVPYIVRLQVTLMPAARNEPYDAYETVSFFAGKYEGGVEPRLAQSSGQSEGVPYIIPLLVTDNLEATAHSNTVDVMRQFALALSFLNPEVSATGEVQRLTDEIASVTGKDLNSVLTVARVSDNTLRVRLGALNQAAAQYAMVPRTHNVTLVLLVPATCGDADRLDADRTIRLVSKTTMLDAERASALEARSPSEVRSLLCEPVMRRLPRLDSAQCVAVGSKLLSAAQTADVGSFDAEFKQFGGEPAGRDMLWLDLISLMVGGQYTSASFDLPPQLPPTIDEGQVALVFDEPENDTATVKLWGGQGLPAGRLHGKLVVTPAAGAPRALVAKSVSVSNGGQEVVLQFPSLAAWGLPGRGDGANLRLILTMDPNPWYQSGCRSEKVPAPWQFTTLRYRQAGQTPTPTTVPPTPTQTPVAPA